MSRHIYIPIFLLFLLTIAYTGAYAQNDNDPFSQFPGRDRKRDDDKVVKDMLAKQQTERDKKDHDDMVKRADQALALTNDLDKAFEEHEKLSVQDEKKLAELEKLVRKIRGELGGSDDDETPEAKSDDDDPKPSNVKAAFDALRSTTTKLVDEVKKTTRFSISAVAIQSSNSVIRIIKFLRFNN